MRNIKINHYIALTLVALALYMPTLSHGFLWDDHNQIINNPYISRTDLVPSYFFTDLWSFSDLQVSSASYRPFFLLLHHLDYLMWGKNPFGFHLTNLLILLFLSFIFYKMLVLILGDQLKAFLGSLIFVVHPITLEIPAFIPRRGAALSLLFFLISIASYIYGLNEKHKKISYFRLGSVLAFMCALLSKETALCLPFIIILYTSLYWRKYWDKLDIKVLKEFIYNVTPYALVILFYIFLRKNVYGHAVGIDIIKSNASLLTALDEMGYYIRSFILPVQLGGQKDAVGQIISYNNIFVSLAFLSLAFLLYFRNKNKNLLFSLGWIVITFLSTICFSPFISAKYLLFPMLGLSVILIESVKFIFGLSRKRAKMWPAGVAAFILLCFFITSTTRGAYKDDLRFFQRLCEIYPNDARVRFNFATTLLESKMENEAIIEFKKVLKIHKGHDGARVNLAMMLYHRGQKDESLKVLSGLKENSKFTEQASRLKGVIYFQKKDMKNAKKEALKAFAANPNSRKTIQLLKYIYKENQTLQHIDGS